MLNRNIAFGSLLIFASALTLIACDDKVELGPEPVACESNDDCQTDEICSEDNICVPKEGPEPNDDVCGDGIVGASEQCDDGEATELCNAECQIIHQEGTLRLTSASVVAPALYTSCDASINAVINADIQSRLTTVRENGEYKLNIAVSTEGFTAADGSVGTVTLHYPSCTAEGCELVENAADAQLAAVFQAEGSCIPAQFADFVAATSGLNAPTGNCIIADSEALTLDIRGQLAVPLTDLVVVGELTFADGQRVVENGVVIGFLSEAAAEAAVLPAGLPIVGGRSLASFLQVETCEVDTVENNEVAGWWFALNFAATEVQVGSDNGDGGDNGDGDGEPV